MNRIHALREIGHFVRAYRNEIAKLPLDSEGKPSNLEIRKLLAVDTDMAIDFAAVLATIYFLLEHETSLVAHRGFEGGNS